MDSKKVVVDSNAKENVKVEPTLPETARCDRLKVSKTLRYAASSNCREGFTSPAAQIVDGEPEFVVDTIAATKPGGDDVFFLVKWAGWPWEEATWEPLSNLTHCERALQAFFDRLEAQLAEGCAQVCDFED